MVNKIVIVGPESTGKSTLCEQLAQHFHTSWCPEFAREYLLSNGKDYSFGDLLDIARGQLALEEEFTRQLESCWSWSEKESCWINSSTLHTSLRPPILFIDTDMYVMKVWCEYVFGKCHPFILDEIAKRNYQGYLLCAPDLPWIKDELREYPDEKNRIELYHLYQDLLIHQSTPWKIIRGNDESRLTFAIAAVQEMIPETQKT
ncbi:MAG: AAA family ATPase [Chitinophagia bacterium]|jgi:nicotinamide riboside kinase